MTAYLDIINDKEYSGKTIWSIIRRLYGRSKDIVLRQCAGNSPEWGYIGQVNHKNGGGMDILCTISSMSGPSGVDNRGVDSDAEAAEMRDLEENYGPITDIEAEYEKQCRIAEKE